MTFVRDRGFIIFAYILDDFEKWLGDNEDTQRGNIKACLQLYKKQFEILENNVNNKDLTCLTLNVYAKAGTVKNIKGFDVREFYVQLVSDLKNRNL